MLLSAEGQLSYTEFERNVFTSRGTVILVIRHSERKYDTEWLRTFCDQFSDECFLCHSCRILPGPYPDDQKQNRQVYDHEDHE